MIIDASYDTIDLKTSSRSGAGVGAGSVTKFIDDWKALDVAEDEEEHVLNEDSGDETTVVYLVTEQWMSKFREFMKDPLHGIDPGMITNCSLLVSDQLFSDSEEDVGLSSMILLEDFAQKALASQHLKHELQEGKGKDYIVVSPDKWNLLESMFTSDISIPRIQYRNEEGLAVTEVYPISMTCVVKDVSGTTEKREVRGSLHIRLQSFLGDIGNRAKRVYKFDITNALDDAVSNGMEMESEEIELKLRDVVSDILEDGDEIVVEVSSSEIESDDACSVTAMEGDNISQADNMSVDVDEIFSDIQTLGTHQAHNLSVPTSTTSLVPFNGPETSISSTSKDLLQPTRNSQRLRNFETRALPRGLSNLGNTCFMNATLQCFASLEPLVKYYTQGGFVRDMNVDNVLGTGGKLARAFSGVMKELLYDRSSSSGWNGAVSPRDFKFVLGQKASQFIGYDQHDCQELATYLLDSLHEDCNLIEKKPYVEKPEKKENETDNDAACVAWQAHQKREDSYIVNNFSFLMKSHVECPRCQKVSTTFDPMVYLSVPIPCSNEATIVLTFIPLKGISKAIKITLDKSSRMNELSQKISDIVGISANSLCFADIWHNEVYKYYKPTEFVDTISSNDTPFVFELEDAKHMPHRNNSLDASLWLESSDLSEFSLEDISSMLEPIGNQFEKTYVANNFADTLREFCDDDVLKDRSKSQSFADVIEYLNKLQAAFKSSSNPQDPESTKVIYCALLMHQEALSKCLLISVSIQIDNTPYGLSSGRRSFSGGASRFSSNGKKMSLRVHRIPVHTTVFQLRRMLAERYEYAWNVSDFVQEYNSTRKMLLHESSPEASSLVQSSENDNSNFDRVLVNGPSPLSSSPNKPQHESNTIELDAPSHGLTGDHHAKTIPPPLVDEVPLEIFKRVPLSYLPPTANSRYGTKPIGSITLEQGTETSSDSFIHLPVADSDSENIRIGMLFREDRGSIYVTLPHSLVPFFDSNRFDDKETFSEDPEYDDQKDEKKISLIDCIDSFTVREQLPVSESYYCSVCKDHVQAYKECGVYFVPNILVVHLKRFQFSSSSHRRDKIESYIDYPIEGLDLSGIVMRNEVSMKCVGEQNQLPPIYDLVAVSNHFGGLGGGHYTAHAKRNGKWYYFDDSRVSEVTDETEIVSPAGYVLYYVRRGVTIPDEFYDDEIISAVTNQPNEVKQRSDSFSNRKTSSPRISSSRLRGPSASAVPENKMNSNKLTVDDSYHPMINL